MHVVQVAPKYPPNVGGVETHVRELGERLVARGHDVTVVTADAGSEVEPREMRDRVSVVRHRAVAPGDAFHVAPGVLRSVRRLDGTADVVHAHNYHALPLLFAAIGVREAAFVVTPHYHGESANSVRDALLSAYRFLGWWGLRQSTTTIAVSEWERGRLRQDFGIESRVIPNGISVDRFEGPTPVDRDRPYLLTVGRLEEYKGVQHVIRALSELPEFDLLVAGDGPYRDALRGLAVESGVRDRVRFLGYVDDDRLPGLYAGAAAFLTASAFEAFGLTVGEALASGTPCVVREERALSDWTDRRDCVGVTDPSPTAIANAIRRAVERDAPSEPLPTWDGVVDQVESVYRSVT